MHPHAGGHGEQPGLPASRNAAGNLAQAHRARTAAENPTCGSDRIFGYLEILRQHVSGTEGNNAKGHARAGNPWNYVKDGAIAAANNDRIVAFCYCPRCLGSGGSVFACLQNIDRGAALAERTVNAIDVSAPCSCLLQHRVNEEQDLSHGASELRRLLPGGEYELLKRLPLPR